ncbi:hypothetical protein ELH55_34215 (plasmid) [Rhizobium ruizarguesonis]|uniref:hypothetical protein n=1 Tax=Rhizobium ruizarguesonis TaxID=2081791 RepID=UPI001032317C|nr:hypothetical protein [Rhizobium ruizarguesonis]TBA94345.1 hypothetical protein ELH55_34215 [Rhizobium ruizarguesonis]
MTVPSKACWRSDEVARIVANEALEHQEAIFLATHSPIRGFEVTGSHQNEIASPDEQAVLETLSNRDRNHAFCVVQGEAGSGKSHLIRWLAVNWPYEDDLTLLLQRADGSLEGALRQLRQRLPEEFKALFDRLGRRQRATEDGRAKSFLSNLANALRPNYYEKAPEDVAWCAEYLPGALIDNLTVKEEWEGPARILRLLDGKGADGEDERNSQSAVFNLFDMVTLAAAARNVSGSGVRGGTERLTTKIRDEADIIEDYRLQGWDDPDELEGKIRKEVPASIALMEALNRRRNDAIQHLLGVSAEGLKDLFREVRTALASRGQRLVLLLEDITSWEGIDNSLIDVLVTNADTRANEGDSDLCPLISVVGVTPAYRNKLPANYRGRITHELKLGSSRHEGELQDVAALREENARLEFVTRYLNAVRAGSGALSEWRELRRGSLHADLPNPCTHCEFREGCHATFGAQDDVGLFPFTASSLGNLFAALNDRDNGLTWRTPRGMLQAVVTPVLTQADAIQLGQFPTRLLDSRALLPESRNLSPLAETLLTTRLSGTGVDRTQMSRLIAYWGDRNRPVTTSLGADEMAFAGISQKIYEAFGLPWLGDDTAEIQVENTTPVLPLDEAPPAAPLETSGGEVKREWMPRAQLPKTRTTPPPPARGPVVNKTDLQRMRDQLQLWKEKGVLEDLSGWNRVLHRLVHAIDPSSVGLDQHTFEKLFTDAQVKLEGTGSSRRQSFWIPKDEWVLNGLDAFQTLSLEKSLTLSETEYYRRSLATMLRRLAPAVGDYADLRLGFSSERERWEPSVSCAQILLARAWLRGTTTPDLPLPIQFRAILSDEDGPESDPQSRTTNWQGFLSKTHPHNKMLRGALREMLSLPQGESRAFGLADLSKVASHLILFRATLRFSPLPKETDSGIPLFETMKEIIDSVGGSLQPLLRYERERLDNQVESLESLRRGYGVRAHIERLEKVIDAVATHVPGASPDAVKRWKAQFDRVKPRFETNAAKDVQLFMAEVADLKSENKVLGLKGAVLAPSRDLAQFRELAFDGENLVKALLDHVRDNLDLKADTGRLAKIHAFGKMLSGAQQQAMAEAE